MTDGRVKACSAAKGPGRGPLEAQGGLEGGSGLTLPLAMILIALGVAAITSVSFLIVHIRTIARTQDEDRAYYAMDAAIESVLADLVRGADALAPSYQPAIAELNGVTPAVDVAAPGGGVKPDPGQQYFDPGVRDPRLRSMGAGDGYLLHLLSLQPSSGAFASLIQVNWSFTLSGTAPQGTTTLKLLRNAEALSPGRTIGCPVGDTLASAAKYIEGQTGAAVRLGPVELALPGVYSVAFCLTGSGVGTLTTNTFKPSGAPGDTWVYALAFKDYLVTARAEGAAITAYVRQVPGPVQPPASPWAPNSISWIQNLVTVHEWRVAAAE